MLEFFEPTIEFEIHVKIEKVPNFFTVRMHYRSGIANFDVFTICTQRA